MNTRKPRILCVDDELPNLKLLEALLAPRGYEVVKAGNGKEAIEKLEEMECDLVLLDVMMPEMNGFDVCKRIKDADRFRNMPVVMITALRSKEDRIRGIEAGAEDFISKPFDQGEILARINMLLRIKTLNDRLNQAYSKITTITSFGRMLISEFDTLDFDFMFDEDQVVSRLMGPADGAAGRPGMIMVGFFEEGGRRWYLYELALEGLKRQPVDFDIGETLPEKTGTKIVFLNEADLAGSELRHLAAKLEAMGKPVSNVVGFLSDDFSIAALNYGREVTEYDAAVLESLVTQSLFLRSIAGQIKETENAFVYVVNALARAAEANDEDTGKHILRVGEYCAIISKQIGMPETFINTIRLHARMHDVGKIHVPTDILKKPGKLTAEEFEVMKEHTLCGAKILGDHIRLAMAKEIALSHHERWDGEGYPYGLKGDRIPLAGRIMNMADIYDVLRNKRVYKPAYDHTTTYRIISEGDGRTMPHHFDPRVLKAFREMATQFEEIYERLSGAS